MEVVVLSVAESNKGANYVDERCVFLSAFDRARASAEGLMPVLGSRTHGRGVLAEVGLLVAAEETLGLGLGGSASRELLVEADDLLHADSVRGRPNSLIPTSANTSCMFWQCCGSLYGIPVGAEMFCGGPTGGRIETWERSGWAVTAWRGSYTGRGHLEKAISAVFNRCNAMQSVPWAG